ncbi:hypothetical protein OpiT1DRAFT_05959 [Opitutaceae bacterium TAV1]|nr:hypothetical protein OpiT1DRAFT_05959 [Opitutaceae bacterium TAV1]
MIFPRFLHALTRFTAGLSGAVPAFAASALLASPASSPPLPPSPPIPIPFHLEKAGWVTLVIEDAAGVRVRNLVSATWFEAGNNTAWWDGTDDLGRDTDAARHGVYRIPARYVMPGNYTVRGLVRDAITPRYEFSVYTAGNPAWPTSDGTGAWLSNHSPPQAVCFVPAGRAPGGQPLVYLGSYVSEGRDGIAWVDLDGRKRGGRTWVGGNWTGAPFMARDDGAYALKSHLLYAASVWSAGKRRADLRLTAITAGNDIPILQHQFATQTTVEIPRESGDHAAEGEIGGLAVRNAIVIVSLPRRDELLFIDARAKTLLGAAPLTAPRGLAFDSAGRLLVLSGKKLLRYDSATAPGNLPAPVTLASPGLDDPQQLTLDSTGNIYVSDHGASHCVKIFTPDGARLIRRIGKPDAPSAAPEYDPLRMNHPFGLAIDSRGNLWVAERDFLPKRVSVWTPDGRLAKAFYGPGKYAGGGTLDPLDKTRFYYADDWHGTLEFQLDWKTGASRLARVLYRFDPAKLDIYSGTFTGHAPETAIYHNGQRYFTNCYNNSPTQGSQTVFLFKERAGILQPVAGIGVANGWQALMKPEFQPLVPPGADLSITETWRDNGRHCTFFIWSDLNADGLVQPDEVAMRRPGGSPGSGGITVSNDLAFSVARLGGDAVRFSPTGFTTQGVPRYNIDSPVRIATAVKAPTSTGGDQMLEGRDGWSIVTLGLGPFAAESLCGVKDGVPRWSYPSLWPGLHASHEAARPDRPGQIIGTTRLLGGLIDLPGAGATGGASDAGQLWAVNGNHGNFYLFTTDGLFVATLFQDMRMGKPWAMPAAIRGTDLGELSLNDENFWPTLTRTSDGQVYLVDGNRTSIVRIEGLDSIHRLPASSLPLTVTQLEACVAWSAQREAIRQQEQGGGRLDVAICAEPPLVDGALDEWAKGAWADIDKSGTAAYFNSDTKPFNVTGAIAISGTRLYAAWRTGLTGLLQNSGDPVAPFKTGGALDLMIGAGTAAGAVPDPARAEPVAGDLRLLVTLVNERPLAILYHARVPGTPEDRRVPFSSPWRTVYFDKVEDVSTHIEFAASRTGDFEISIPLAVLGITPRAGQEIKGDIGILRGNGLQTNARIYWSNKATAITSDLPSEAMLTPALWGTFRFGNPPDAANPPR